jgi:hypothetical protein
MASSTELRRTGRGTPQGPLAFDTDFFCRRAALDVPKEPDRPKPNPVSQPPTQPIGISREGAPRSPRSCSGHA